MNLLLVRESLYVEECTLQSCRRMDSYSEDVAGLGAEERDVEERRES